MKRIIASLFICIFLIALVSAQELDIGYTDDNSNENLLLHTESQYYSSRDISKNIGDTMQIEVYTSIKNGWGFEDVKFKLTEDMIKVEEVIEDNKYKELILKDSNLEEIIINNTIYESIKVDCKEDGVILNKEERVCSKDEFKEYQIINTGKYNDLDRVGYPIKSIDGKFSEKYFETSLGFFETKYFRITIEVPVGYEGEFFLEALGDDGRYGHLDPYIQFDDPTLVDEAYTTYNWTAINVSITEANLKEVIYNWNGTNFTLYNDSLLARLNFDNVAALGDSISLVNDISGTANLTAEEGTITYAAGKFGQSGNFDGERFAMASGSAGNSVTVSFWIKVFDVNTDSYIFNSDNVNNNMVILVGYNHGWLNAYSDGGYLCTNQNLISMTSGEWTYITMTDDGTTFRAYKNGAEVDNCVDNFADVATTAYILGDYAGGFQKFKGNLDEVELWNYARTPEEINQSYMSYLHKVNGDEYLLEVNQTQTVDEGLADGTYTYQAWAEDTGASVNTTGERTVKVVTQIPLTDYTWKANITIGSDDISGAVNYTDYPVLIQLDDLPNDLWNSSSGKQALSTGCDIRFSNDSAGNNELPFEIVNFTLDTAAEFWVKVPTLKVDSDTVIWVWWNQTNSFCYDRDDTYGQYNVWDNYLLVNHYTNDTSTSTYDSTSYQGTGIKSSANNPQQVNTGHILQAEDLDGISDWINYKNPTQLDNMHYDNFTFLSWINPDTMGEGGHGRIFDKNSGVFEIQFDNTWQTKLSTTVSCYSADNFIVANVWQQFAFVWNDDTDTARFFSNGTETSYSGTCSGTAIGDDSTTDFVVGGRTENDRDYDGEFDEVQIYNGTTDVYWLNTTYNIQGGIATLTAGDPQATGVDITPPTWSGFTTNTSFANASVLASIDINDNIALESLGTSIASTNNTGAWVNGSTINFTSTPESISQQIIFNETTSNIVCFKWYLWDNARNQVETDTECITLLFDADSPGNRPLKIQNKTTGAFVAWFDNEGEFYLKPRSDGLATCNTTNKGIFYNDDELNVSCMCDGTAWYKLDGTGTCDGSVASPLSFERNVSSTIDFCVGDVCLSNVALATEPLWTDNFTSYNSSWSSTYNSTYENAWQYATNNTFALITEPLWSANYSLLNDTWSSIFNQTYEDAYQYCTNDTFRLLDNHTFNGDVEMNGNLNMTNNNITDVNIFSFVNEEYLDNLLDGWLRITGSLNVTGNVEVSGDANITGDLNTDGNFTGNQIYGGMWGHNHTATEFTFVDGVYFQIPMINTTHLNGFTHEEDGILIGSNLTTQVAGVYQITYMASGSGKNNHIYYTSIFCNEVNQYNCENHKKMAAGGDIVTQSGNCLIELAVGDKVSMRTADIGGSGSGNYYSANLNLVRIGD